MVLHLLLGQLKPCSKSHAPFTNTLLLALLLTSLEILLEGKGSEAINSVSKQTMPLARRYRSVTTAVNRRSLIKTLAWAWLICPPYTACKPASYLPSLSLPLQSPHRAERTHRQKWCSGLQRALKELLTAHCSRCTQIRQSIRKDLMEITTGKEKNKIHIRLNQRSPSLPSLLSKAGLLRLVCSSWPSPAMDNTCVFLTQRTQRSFTTIITQLNPRPGECNTDLVN